MLRASVLVSISAAATLAVTAPSAELDAAPARALVVEVDDCRCESFLLLEAPAGDSLPWTISWTTDEGHEDGHCAAGGCEDIDEPRPCKGSYRIQVSWPQAPTSPCISEAPVTYRAEGEASFTRMGVLDLSHGFVPIDLVGGDLVICASKALGEEPFTEPDDSVSEIYITCAKGGGLTHFRLIYVREACKPCNQLPDPI